MLRNVYSITQHFLLSLLYISFTFFLRMTFCSPSIILITQLRNGWSQRLQRCFLMLRRSLLHTSHCSLLHLQNHSQWYCSYQDQISQLLLAVLHSLIPGTDKNHSLLHGLHSQEIMHTRSIILLHLDELLESRGMTVSELSERVGITRANMSKIKTGDAKALRFSTLDGICSVLACQPGDLIEYVPEVH